MRRFLLELSIAIALTIGSIIASATGADASDVMVMKAFARASATPAAKSAAAYVSVVNHGEEADQLLSVSSPAAETASLHTTVMDGDVMKMQPAGMVEIPPNGTLEMKPGGLNIMMMGLRAPLKEGSSLDVTLVFEKAGEVKVRVPVGSVSAGN